MSDNLVDFSLFVRREFPTRFFARGDAIFRDGEQADEFFVVGRHFPAGDCRTRSRPLHARAWSTTVPVAPLLSLWPTSLSRRF